MQNQPMRFVPEDNRKITRVVFVKKSVGWPPPEVFYRVFRGCQITIAQLIQVAQAYGVLCTSVYPRLAQQPTEWAKAERAFFEQQRTALEHGQEREGE